MFEITGDDIAALSDDDLRTLIGRLCEAEMRRRGLPVAAVTWGGNQNAKDGGLDVRVVLPAGTAIAGFIPSPQTGVQVKKPDMPRGAILDEMKPSGVLRPVILELALGSGAYVIASGTASTSDLALKNRREAMAEAVKGTPAEGKLTLEFLDRNRIATWVRDHAGMIPWVRSRIGKSIRGWRSYGAWSNPPAGSDTNYLADDHARIRTGTSNDGDGLSAAAGIALIRNALRDRGKVVRLVGLSGVGKTRLVEALFDPSVGTGSLDQSLAIYTNTAEGPDPEPVGLISDLIAAGTRAILVVDNCAADLHRQLTDAARVQGSTVSVITVEYDIRDDQPEGTEVFALDTSSPAIIRKLVERRYPDVSQVDAERIAEFSGGNARVALALAATVGKKEPLANLNDADLFKRLFQQRHDPDASLLEIAEACALVYSFDGEKLSGENAELPALGSLVGKTADEVYKAAAELKRRDLLQERGVWRAILPHAIANNLAKLALENIPLAKLQAVLVDNASKRMLRSFSRRLGYLDGSKEARVIVASWLAPGGLLADVTNLIELGRAMFYNIAPVMPEATLSALESALGGADKETLERGADFVRLLRSLAYDAALFERAVKILTKLALVPGSLDHNEAADALASLFPIALSGTHATVEMRLKVLEQLLRSPDALTRALGVSALEEMLKTTHFSAGHDFEFGGRSRDYGYHPKTGKDVGDWFKAVMAVACPLATSEEPVAPAVRSAITREFRGLWANAGRVEELDTVARTLAKERFWRDGWVAARHTRIYEGAGMAPEALEKLKALEEFLRPKDLVSKVRGLILGSGGGSLDLDDIDEAVDDRDIEAAMARAAAAVDNLGKDVANDPDTFHAVLPELMDEGAKIQSFGAALGEAAENPRAVWDAMVLRLAGGNETTVVLHAGFLSGLQKHDPKFADALLDEALDHPALAQWFPVLQASVVIDVTGVARLRRALDLGLATINTYYGLAYGRAADPIPAPEFGELVKAICAKPGGMPVAMEIVSMRVHSDGMQKRPTAPEVIAAGRALLANFQFQERDRRTNHDDHRLGMVARASLAGPEGAPIVRRLCRDLMTGEANRAFRASDHDDLLGALFRTHPLVMLDELFSGDEKARRKSVQLLQSLLRHEKFVLDTVPDDVLLGWCEGDHMVRYPIAAAVASVLTRSNNNEPRQWTPLATKLLRQAPDPAAVLSEIVLRLMPLGGWSGSLASIFEAGLKLLEELPIDDLPALKGPTEDAKAALRQRIENQRREEAAESRARSDTFE